MVSKVLAYGVVVVLLLTLVGGTAYVLARPSEAQAERSVSRDMDAQADGGYRGGSGNATGDIASADSNAGGRGAGGGNIGGRGVSGGNGGGQGAGSNTGGSGVSSGNGGGQGASGNGGGQGVGNGQPLAEAEVHDWLTVQGTVTVADSELTVQTTDGEVVVGMGQAWYREEAGFVVNVGDEVVVEGYYEDGEFKAGTVDNLSNGQSVTLRDATGRPMWSGRGNGQNRP